MNLGSVVDHTYSVSAGYTLQEAEFAIDAASGQPSYTARRDLFPNIVAMRALYGKDTNADGVVDTYDQVTPTTNALWAQVLAVRIVLVARSSQYEKTEVTSANPQWDVGTAAAVTPAPAACGASKCLTIGVDGPTDWKHYRYKLYDTVVPLRNMLWN
jgi:type IV pilus assembly protein PilW